MSQLAPGDHLCLVSGDLVERQAVLSTFLGEGLQRNERVLYFFTDSDAAASIFGFLERQAWRRYLDSGQLGVAAARDTYLSGEGFQPDRIIDTLVREAEAAQAAGWQGLRVTSEMAWAASKPPDADLHSPPTSPGTRLLLEYEDALRPALSGLPVTVLCQYDRRHFAEAAMDRVIRVHTGRVGVDPLFNGGAMRIFQTFDPPGLRVEGSVDARTCAAFAEALAGLGDRMDDDGDTHLDLGELQFIDLDGLRHVAWAASRLPEGRRLVLHRVPPHHRDLISLLRWDEIPGLRLSGGGT